MVTHRSGAGRSPSIASPTDAKLSWVSRLFVA